MHGTDVANSSLVADPTSRQPGFDLSGSHWTLLNRFRTGHGHCGVTEHRWGLRASADCSCGQPQTMFHIVEQCPLTRLEGVLQKLYSADDDATACCLITLLSAVFIWAPGPGPISGMGLQHRGLNLFQSTRLYIRTMPLSTIVKV